ncbi:MAG: hypothetical protein QOI08_2986 [Actinomycetota bacterium]|nr:hypothetical protein [Actinomycetota bacterium]
MSFVSCCTRDTTTPLITRGLANGFQSSRLKHNTARTGAALAPSAWRTASSCFAIPATSFVRSRFPTYKRRSVRNQPPMSRTSMAPESFLVSTTQMPEGATTMWSMFARVEGMRRSWRTQMPFDLSLSRCAPTNRSPDAPCSHAFVDCGSSVSASVMRPRTRPRASARSSRFLWRRSCFRECGGAGDAEVDRHVVGRLRRLHG